MLTDDHKTKRMCSALNFLTRYAHEGDKFLESILTANETLQNPSNSQEEVMTCLKEQAADFYNSGFQDLINVWKLPSTMLKKITYWQFIYNIAFVN
jgi:hypothetical protein